MQSLSPSDDVKLRKELGLNRQAQIFYALRTAVEPKTVAQIAAKTCIPKNAVLKNLIYLLKKGHVKRDTSHREHTWEIARQSDRLV